MSALAEKLSRRREEKRQERLEEREEGRLARRKKITVFDVILYAIMIMVCFITIYPMYYVFLNSISEPLEVVRGNVTFWPRGLYLDTYKVIAHDSRLWRAYGNTILYAAGTTLLMLFTCVTMAYPLTQPKLKFRKLVVWFVLVPMYISGGMIPAFLVIYKLHLYDTIWAMILPSGMSIMNIILCRTFFMSIPQELAEAASIDGASHYKILGQVMLPLSKPVLAVISIYTLVGTWNSWFNALVYLPSEKLHPLQMYLQRVIIAQTVDLTQVMTKEEMQQAVEKMLSSQQMQYSLIFFISAPIILVYPFFQKHFVKGVMLGSLKG